ncbi:MAG: hypothetical protein WBW74_12865, partial [Xanthobacteraceae bacterium]
PLAAAPALPAEDARLPAAEPPEAVTVVGRRLRCWRAFAILMTLVVLAVVALLAAWRFVPEHVPPMLRPLELMRSTGVGPPPPPAPPRRPAPPQFDE